MERLLVNAVANTVLGPVSAEQLGVVAVHEALLSVVPGAQLAFDVSLDRAQIFETLAGKLADFREHGGGTIVDSTGMFHGRDLPLYEALSRETGVHIIASTGMGPEEMLGGYFLTPQTNPPTPWPAEKFAELFTAEITEGMVMPRVERRAAAGLVVTTTTSSGTTATDASLLRGAARAALATGVPLSLRFGADALSDLEIVLGENLPPERIIVGGLDHRDAASARVPFEVARHGAWMAIDHIGLGCVDHVSEPEGLVAELVAAGHADRVLLSSNAIGVAKGQPDRPLAFSHVLTEFVPVLRASGLDEAVIQQILVDNPRDLLTVRT